MIKGWIVLSVYCEVDDIEEVERLQELGVKLPDSDKFIIKKELIQISNIDVIALTKNSDNSTNLYISGESIAISESPEEVIKLIKQDQLL